METDYLNKYIEELSLESDKNHITLNKIIEQNNQYKNEIKSLKRIKNEIFNIKKLYKNYILSIIISTFSISLIATLLRYTPNILLYLLVSFIGSSYYFSNKYIKLNYYNKYIIELTVELNNIKKLYKYNKSQEMNTLLILKEIDNKINFLKKIKESISICITETDEKENNKCVLVNHLQKKFKNDS